MEVAEAPIHVQSITQKDTKSAIPPQYIQPPENHPIKLNHETATDRDSNILREEIKKACTDCGAFHEINNGVPVPLLDETRKAGCSFFEDLPMTEKPRYGCDSNSTASESYGSGMLIESYDAVLDWRYYFDHHTFPISRRNSSRWPHFPPNYRLSSCSLMLIYHDLGK